MDKIGNYDYPTTRTFKDTLRIAEEALLKFGGVMPIAEALKKLGYNVNPRAISGPLYKQIDDMCMYGLFTREIRGAIKTTPLAIEALDPNDPVRAATGKVKALRGIELIARAFDAWGGQMPDDSALPAKLSELTGADWTESKVKTERVKIIISEAIPYLQAFKGGPIPITPPMDRRDDQIRGQAAVMMATQMQPSAQKPTGGIEEFVLGDGIRIYLPKENIKATWEKTKKVLDMLIEEKEDTTPKVKEEKDHDEAPVA